MKVKKYIIPKTHIGLRLSQEENKMPWRGMFILGLKFIPKVEYNVFVRIQRRVVAIGYHRYW